VKTRVRALARCVESDLFLEVPNELSNNFALLPLFLLAIPLYSLPSEKLDP
jgi:hypothetical protein